MNSRGTDNKIITYTDTISVEQYNSLRQSVGWKALDRQQAWRGLDGSVHIAAAYDETGRVVGSARIVGDGRYMHLIADVMVHPEFQGRGIGAELLTRLNRWLDSLAGVMVNLMVTVGNEDFYRKLGFVARPNENMGAGMVKWINP